MMVKPEGAGDDLGAVAITPAPARSIHHPVCVGAEVKAALMAGAGAGAGSGEGERHAGGLAVAIAPVATAVAAPPRDLQRVKNAHRSAPSRSRSPSDSPKRAPRSDARDGLPPTRPVPFPDTRHPLKFHPVSDS